MALLAVHAYYQLLVAYSRIGMDPVAWTLWHEVHCLGLVDPAFLHCHSRYDQDAAVTV
jgi:hypothetical protein